MRGDAEWLVVLALVMVMVTVVGIPPYYCVESGASASIRAHEATDFCFCFCTSSTAVVHFYL
jgi:hypothetical protein